MAVSLSIQQGDIGTDLTLTVYRANGIIESQLGLATTLQIILGYPSNASKTKAAVLVTDGTDGKMRYRTASVGDLDAAGTWEIQGYIVIPGAWTGRTTTKTFNVLRNL